jgi:predicted DNA-binding helix-hairpin-helix protein
MPIQVYSIKVELTEKLSILSSTAKYDASCASSGSGEPRHNTTGKKTSTESNDGIKFGVREQGGICHSWTEDGRCVSLLKVLFSNVCRYDCAYCVNRSSADTQRTSFTPDELVQLTCEFYRRNYIEGLFLSSGVFADPDIVMEQLIAVAKKLRIESGYNGYIHLKVIPGSGEKMIREAGLWADRLSANIELPTEKSLQYLAPQKSGKTIFGTMNEIQKAEEETEEDRRHKLKSAPVYAPAGQSTQLIVGASGEDDRTIIGLSGALYKKYSRRRVYYSAYMPVTSLPPHPAGPAFSPDAEHTAADAPDMFEHSGVSPRRLLVREHRLYQADWLMRFYHFQPEEILNEEHPFLDPALDPKTAWALLHPDRFPVELKKASYEELLRVPGVGAQSARRIIEVRRSRPVSFDGLRRLGVALKRARYFITLGGEFYDRPDAKLPVTGTQRILDNPERLRRILADGDDGLQLPLFDF